MALTHAERTALKAVYKNLEDRPLLPGDPLYEPALKRAEEAVRMYRQLAAQRPDAFLPDLARSLLVRGNILEEASPGEAVATFAEAIRVLTRFLVRLPSAHAPLMQAIRSRYLETAESANIEPDLSLLAPVDAVLEKLNTSESE